MPLQKRLPDVRSDADCRRLIATLKKPVYRGCFTLIYADGLRISEAVTLPVSAVDSKQSSRVRACTHGSDSQGRERFAEVGHGVLREGMPRRWRDGRVRASTHPTA